jgi:peptidoglycan/xylan/chitin deacetylase (PgdA/CDA1 family)
VLAALALAGAAAPAGAACAKPAWSAPILVYHRFDARTPAATTVTLAAFEAQLAWLESRHYRIRPLSELVAQLDGAEPAPAGPEAAITVDDGHRSVYTELYPLLLKRRIPVTLFIYPSAISNAAYALTWDQLREMQASDLVDVQSHTYWHPNFRTERRRLSPNAYARFVDQQLQRSKLTLESRLGHKVTLLAWPFGIVDADLEAAARRAGYVAGFAYEGGLAAPGEDLMALSRIPVTDSDRGARLGAKLHAGAQP